MDKQESSSEEEQPAKVVRTIPQFKSFKSAPAPSSSAPPTAAQEPSKEKQSERGDSHRKRRHEEEEKEARRHDRHHRHRSRDRHRDDSDEDRRRRRDRDREQGRDKDRDRERDRDRDRHRDKDKDRARERDDDRRGHSHHRRSRSRSRSRSRHGDHSRHRSRRKSPAENPKDPEGDIVPWNTPNVQFIVDRRGDPHNITYGTIHRYSIPQYHRAGSGRVVGLPRRMRIEKDKGDGKGLVVSEQINTYSDGNRLSGQAGYIFAMEKSKPLRIKDKGEECAEEPFAKGHEFVALSSSGKKRKRSVADDETWKSNVDYRSIHGMERAKEGNISDSDLEEASSASKHEIEVFDAATREKTIRLSRLVDSEPNNIDAWFEFIEHQQAMVLGLEGGRRRKVRQGERQGLEEVKASIFEKALSKNRGNNRLLVAYMETGARIWDPAKLKLKWQEVLKANPSLIELWTRYLNFRITDFASFRYRECIQEFENCLEMLRKAVHVHGLTVSEKEKLEDIILYIFLRLTIFVRESGFSELATASWQCLLELNTALPKKFSPPETHQQHVEVIESLEAFWDSEILRIGEVGAKGWDAYASEDIGDFPDPKDQDSHESLKLNTDDPHLFETWAGRETEISGRLPARTTDEVEEDDPFQVILFNDVKGYMYYFQTDSAQHKLGYAFLNFCGVMVPQSFSLDPFVRNDLALMKDEYLGWWFWPQQSQADVKLISWIDGEAMETERKSGFSRSPFGFKSPNMPMTSDNTCTNPSRWFAPLADISALEIDIDFVARFVKQLSLRLEDERLAHIFLAIESCRDPKAVKKAARALLKHFPTSLPLYNAYAQLEWQAGNVDAARNVFIAALGLSKDTPADQRVNPILLWHSRVWEELNMKEYSKVVGMLVCIPDGAYEGDGEEPSGATLLRARRYLDENRYYMLSEKEYENAIMYTTCHALLDYVSSEIKDVDAPLKLFEQLESDFKQRQLDENELYELLLLAKCRFLHLHMTTSKYFKAQILRDVLEEAISKFPNNTSFLSLYVWNEGRTRIENRVRTIIQDKVLKEGNETSNAFVFALWAELHLDASRINASAVRNIFEKAVENERTGSSVELWILYLNFEIRQANPRRAKDVLFRAIRACPWSKDIAILAFTKLASALGFEEMRKIHAVMVEKELRIHVDIEETLEDWDERYGRTKGMRSLDPGVSVKPLPDDPDSEEQVDEV